MHERQERDDANEVIIMKTVLAAHKWFELNTVAPVAPVVAHVAPEESRALKRARLLKDCSDLLLGRT